MKVKAEMGTKQWQGPDTGQTGDADHFPAHVTSRGGSLVFS